MVVDLSRYRPKDTDMSACVGEARSVERVAGMEIFRRRSAGDDSLPFVFLHGDW